MLAATNVAARAQEQHRPFSPLRGNGAGDIQRSMKPLNAATLACPCFLQTAPLSPLDSGITAKWSANALTPPLFSSAQMRTWTSGGKLQRTRRWLSLTAIGSGPRSRKRHPHRAKRARKAPYTACATVGKRAQSMPGLSLVCAMTLSIIKSGYQLEWNEGGPPPGISNEPPVHAPGSGIHRGVHPHGPRTGHDEGGL
jgi:hypothetical protein